MPRLYKRGTWWWASYTVGGETYRESCRTKNKAVARTWARRREIELADPAVAAAQTATLGMSLISMVEERRAAGRAPRTIEFYTQMAGPLLRLLGDISLSALKPSDIDCYIRARIDEGVKRNTVSKELKTLRSALRVAVRLGCYHKPPEPLFPARFDAQYEPGRRWLTKTQVELVLQELPPHRSAQAQFILGTGARLGESAAAQPEDVDWNEGTVKLRGTKTRRSARTVPILSSTEHYLRGSYRCLPFPSWGRSNASRDLNAAAERAGVGRLRPTDLRRTAAMWLRQSGASASAIAEYLGHTSSRMVEQVYGRLQGAELGKLLERETA